ncbi:MAG: dethiobiotin synthase [Neisseria sp.]|nr:dethiobiotin synthase [Neisseria sp.]
MMAVYFVAGTDTGVGKTFCTAALLYAAQKRGRRALGFKPVACGADESGENADVRILMDASSRALGYTKHNCYTFRRAAEPHLAAAAEGREIDLGRLSNGLDFARWHGEFVLVEGAGGWFAPLNKHHSLADWVAGQNLPVIMVAGMGEGCINHALLTAAAVRSAGLTLAGWIANCANGQPYRLDDYVNALYERLDAPLLGLVPHLAGNAQKAADYLAAGRLNI